MPGLGDRRTRISQRRTPTEFEMTKINIDLKAENAVVEFSVLDQDGAVISKSNKLLSTKDVKLGAKGVEEMTVTEIADNLESKVKKHIEDNL